MNRCFLFVPGNNPAMLQNADIFHADAVIFDLEDAVSVSEKDAARQLLKHFFETLTKQPYDIYVRINALTSSLGAEDLSSILSDCIKGIVLPKAHTEDIKALTKLLETFEAAKRMKNKTRIIPIIETAKSVLEIEAMAQLPRISGMLLGAEDLTSDMEIERTKVGIEIEYPRAKMAYACKAFGLDAIDTPFTDVDDEAGLKADTIHAQKLGMNAKTAIHPNQVETINQIFSPTEAQIRWARRIVIADTEAQLKHLGVFSLDGKMIDKPVVDRAKKLLEKAKHYHMLGEISDE